MDTAILHGVKGLGKLSVTPTPDGTIVKGLWYSLGTEGWRRILEAQEDSETVAYDVLIPTGECAIRIRCKVRILSLSTDVDPDTGHVQLTAAVYTRFPIVLDA